MGKLNVFVIETNEERQTMMRHILNDVKAFDYMWRNNMFESGVSRIGAEQEFFLTDSSFFPTNSAMEILEDLNDNHFTTELALFNLEANLDPLPFTGSALSQTHHQLKNLLTKARESAKKHNHHVVLVGILPTITKKDLEIENLTPLPRYSVLNDAMLKCRGGDFEFRIGGIDELVAKHDNLLYEACNTSFQVHLQVDPKNFVNQYNWAQAIAGPVLAISTNSPLLLGKELWHETRIALFEQAVDLRKIDNLDRHTLPRVGFGEKWLENSLTEIYQNDVARFPLLVGADIKENALEVLKAGGIPKLSALGIHNGTIYKWNRPCFGITDGKPHLRIENRYLPSGPTITDEIANMAFWLGLMNGIDADKMNIAELMDFDDARQNFTMAAKHGLASQFRWTDHKVLPADRLILDILLPIAEKGLEKAEIDKKERDFYLSIIEERAKSHHTGSAWLVKAFRTLKRRAHYDEAMVTITAGMYNRQWSETPVHNWEPPRLRESRGMNIYSTIASIMSRDIITVHPDDTIDVAVHLMGWHNVSYLPVEDETEKLVGYIDHYDILKFLSQMDDEGRETTSIASLMHKNLVTLSADTPFYEALKLMRQEQVKCLLITDNEKLVGMVTAHDFAEVTLRLLEDKNQEKKEKKRN